MVKGTNGRRTQIARARVGQWTPRTEQRFLGVLGATCNVKAACAAVGMHAPSAYAHRKRWRAFAAKWDVAVDEGYMRIEAGLIENGCNLFSAPECPPAIPMPPMTVEQALHILHMHKHEVRGVGKPPGIVARARKLDEVRDSIMRKIDAIERAATVSEEERAASEREWARRRLKSDG